MPAAISGGVLAGGGIAGDDPARPDEAECARGDGGGGRRFGPWSAPAAPGRSGPKSGRAAGRARGGGGKGVRPVCSSFRSRSIISLFWPSSSVLRWVSSRDFCSIPISCASAWPRQASRGSTWAPGARMLVVAGFADCSPESLLPVSEVDSSAAPMTRASRPASSRYWRRLTVAVAGSTLAASVIEAPLPDDEEIGRCARAEHVLLEAHRHDAGLVEIATGEVQIVRREVAELIFLADEGCAQVEALQDQTHVLPKR